MFVILLFFNRYVFFYLTDMLLCRKIFSVTVIFFITVILYINLIGFTLIQILTA